MALERQERHENTEMASFVVIALGGSSIEWYNFFLYAIAAVLVFPFCFFRPVFHPTLV